MPLSKFWDLYFARRARCHGDDVDDVDDSDSFDDGGFEEKLDCKQSTYKSVLKWARAMHKARKLNLKESKGRKGRTRFGGPVVISVSRQASGPSSGGKDSNGVEISLTAEALAALTKVNESDSVMPKPEDRKLSFDDSRVQEDCSVAVSEAATSNSVATSAFEFRPTLHLKARQKARNVTDREIKSVLKHAEGKNEHRFHDGGRILTSDGLTIVTSGGRVVSVWRDEKFGAGKASPVENAWYSGGLMGDKTRFVVEDCHSAIHSSMASRLDFLFGNSWGGSVGPLHEVEVRAACSKFSRDFKGKNSDGGLQILAFLNQLKSSYQGADKTDHTKSVVFYSRITRALRNELQKSLAHTVTKEEALKLLHAWRSPKFWNVMEPAFRESPNLKKQFKTHLARDHAKSPWPPDQLMGIFLMRDVDVFPSIDEDTLFEQVMNLAAPCHIMDGDEVREGHPPYVTLQVKHRPTNRRGGKRKQMNIQIVGLNQKQAEEAARYIRRSVGCSCSVGALEKGTQKGELFRGTKPGGPIIKLTLASKEGTVVKIANAVKDFAPLQYRRLFVEEGDGNRGKKVRGDKGLDSRVPQLLPIVDEEDHLG